MKRHKKFLAVSSTTATIRSRLFLTLMFICAASSPIFADDSVSNARDLYPDTWYAVDALGRHTPTSEEVGTVKTDKKRTVGIFYITWHTQGLSKLPYPYTSDVSKILQEAPDARLDAQHPAWHGQSSFHWGEPETGYFLSQDEYVIRRDMSQLSDAGVDVIILDVTNAVLYWEEWDKLFSTMEKMRAEGNATPQFCFWSFNGDAITVVQKLYERYYKEPKYQNLWFYWDGKPLLLYNATPTFDANGTGNLSVNPNYDPEAKENPEHPHYLDPDYCEEHYKDYTKEVKDFFTLRCMWWGYYKWGGKRYIGTEDCWSFGYDLGNEDVAKLSPEELVSKHNGEPEEAAVTPAQHPSSLIGKSWTRENGEPELNEYDLPKPTYVERLGKVVEHPEEYGIYFQDRWDEALSVDPPFIYLNDWNEWSAGKYHTPEVLKAMNFMRRGQDATYFFVDQYNAEFNRCIQPMKGGYTDNYYMQMVDNIRRYKGVRQTPKNVGYIAEPASAEESLKLWDSIETEYRDTIGDVFHRDAVGYSGERYVDDSGRNDFTTCKVGVDPKKIYFFAETADDWTAPSDPNWGLLFINADADYETGWYGYDYLVNKTVLNDKKTTLCKWSQDAQSNEGKWEEISEIDYAVQDNRLVVGIDRSLLDVAGSSFTLDYKWSDNPADLETPISLCIAGDTAPNRRFNYRFIWKEK